MVKPANLFVNYAVIRADIDILYKRRINTVLKVKIHIAFRKEYKCMYFLLCSRHLIIFEKQIFFLILKLYFPDYQDWSRRKLGYLIYLLFARISKKKKKKVNFTHFSFGTIGSWSPSFYFPDSSLILMFLHYFCGTPVLIFHFDIASREPSCILCDFPVLRNENK